jgi:hypothetical protein
VERLAPADRAVLQWVLTSSGVERTPVPPASSYAGELVRAAVDALSKAVERGARMVHLPRRMLIAAVFVAAAVALFLVVRSLLPRLHLGRRAAPGTMATVATPGPAFELDAAGWRAEIERRLAAGRAVEALEAAWWWLARSLAGLEAEPDWTSRDLIARGRRPDLSRLIRRLDAFTYGPLRPEPEDVRELVARLEAALV